jgi:hypothetical protein
LRVIVMIAALDPWSSGGKGCAFTACSMQLNSPFDITLHPGEPPSAFPVFEIPTAHVTLADAFGGEVMHASNSASSGASAPGNLSFAMTLYVNV